jgi:hypothetical protein
VPQRDDRQRVVGVGIGALRLCGEGGGGPYASEEGEGVGAESGEERVDDSNRERRVDVGRGVDSPQEMDVTLSPLVDTALQLRKV